MTTSFNSGVNGLGTFELLGSPRSERNYGGISPIAHTGRYSQPDLRFWDANASFFSESTPFSSYIDQGNGFDELSHQCETTGVAINSVGPGSSDIRYVSLEESPYVSEALPFQQPAPSSSTPLDRTVQISQAVAEEAVESPAENAQQNIHIFNQWICGGCRLPALYCRQRIGNHRSSMVFRHNMRASQSGDMHCAVRQCHYELCTKCDASFNFERNLDVHMILGHSSQANYIPGSECTFCESGRRAKTFQRYHAYLAHMKQHMKPDQFFCSICTAEFEFPNLLRRHRRLVHGMLDEEAGLDNFSAELAYCPHCCSMVALEQVEAHRLLHSIHLQLDNRKKRWDARKEKSQKAIEAMKKAFEANSECRYSKQKAFPCDLCEKCFSRATDLAKHVSVHDSLKKWSCTMCEKRYSHKAGLDDHIKTVHKNPLRKMVTCKICSQVFAKQSNLNRHIKMQHPIGVTKAVLDCPECSCVFANSRTLTRHRREAHGSDIFSPFCCNVCNRCFPKASLLRRHNLIHDPSESSKPYQCNRCFKRFNLKSTLKLHMDIHARKDIDDPMLTNPKCPICMKHLSSRNALRKHMAIHQCNFECSVCFQKFSTLHRLDKHRCVPQGVLQNGENVELIELSSSSQIKPLSKIQRPPKRYHCQTCSSSFYSFRGYKEHCAQHRGLRPHLCWTCHKSFRTAQLLELHREVHSRGPVYCEYCPAILQSRNQYTQHVHSVHQAETGVNKQSGSNVNDRVDGAVSTQSFPDLNGRELAENLFSIRAQSADHSNNETTVAKSKSLALSEQATSEERRVRCEVCRHLYNTVPHLVEHWMNTTSDRDHSFCVMPCPLCNYTANGVLVGVEHMKESHPHVVDAVQKKSDKAHIKFVSANSDESDGNSSSCESEEPRFRKKHKCKTCNSSFTKPSDLVRHIRVHTGERPYKCDICQRAFRVVSALYAHARTHTRTQAEHPCAVCGGVFFSRSSLALHLRIHNGEKPLQCRYCTQAFRASSMRRQHEITWHGAPGGHICKRSPCPICNACKRRRTMAELRAQCVSMSPSVSATPALQKTSSAKSTMLLPVKRLAKCAVMKENIEITHSKQFVETIAEISKLPANEIKRSESSAFGPVAKIDRRIQSHEAEFFITARRISHNEYSVNISKCKPKSIRSQVDAMVSLSAGLLLDSASRNASIHVTLSDSQILSISCIGVVKAVHSCDSVVMRARPADPSCPSTVELLPPAELVEYIKRCDICEVNFYSKETSDAHFVSEDHETAQITQFLPTAVHDAIEHSSLPATAAPLHRKDEKTDFTCKLCGRKFLDMEPLVAHIRLEHERDHPPGITRPLARTAPIH